MTILPPPPPRRVPRVRALPPLCKHGSGPLGAPAFHRAAAAAAGFFPETGPRPLGRMRHLAAAAARPALKRHGPVAHALRTTCRGFSCLPHSPARVRPRLSILLGMVENQVPRSHRGGPHPLQCEGYWPRDGRERGASQQLWSRLPGCPLYSSSQVSLPRPWSISKGPKSGPTGIRETWLPATRGDSEKPWSTGCLSLTGN